MMIFTKPNPGQPYNKKQDDQRYGIAWRSFKAVIKRIEELSHVSPFYPFLSIIVAE